MAEHPNPRRTSDGSPTVDDVLGHRIGNEEHPAEGRVDEAQREPQSGRGDDDKHPGRQERDKRTRPIDEK